MLLQGYRQQETGVPRRQQNNTPSLSPLPASTLYESDVDSDAAVDSNAGTFVCAVRRAVVSLKKWTGGNQEVLAGDDDDGITDDEDGGGSERTKGRPISSSTGWMAFGPPCNRRRGRTLRRGDGKAITARQHWRKRAEKNDHLTCMSEMLWPLHAEFT